jgi:hypothetical protein
MVKIEKQGDNFLFVIQGMHKLWAFKSVITIKAAHVVDVHLKTDKIGFWKGWRMPGTDLPGVITAGTYYTDGKRVFWDVMKNENTIVVQLQNEKYDKLIVEVENPQEAIAMLSGKE